MLRRYLIFAVSVLFLLPLSSCRNVKVENTPLPVSAEEIVEPFLFSERLQVKVNNPFDDFQAVIQVPEGKIVVIEYVSANVFGNVRDNEEFELYVTGAARSAQGVSRPRHFVTQLTRTDRTSRNGNAFIQHAGGGLVKTYAVPSQPPGFITSINITVTSNIAVNPPRELFADVQLSGRLVNAMQ